MLKYWLSNPLNDTLIDKVFNLLIIALWLLIIFLGKSFINKTFNWIIMFLSSIIDDKQSFTESCTLMLVLPPKLINSINIVSISCCNSLLN